MPRASPPAAAWDGPQDGRRRRRILPPAKRRWRRSSSPWWRTGAQGRPVTDRVNGPFGGSAEGGLEPAGIRPAVCAPIEVDGTVVECLYVTRGRNGGLFGPEEERLAAFIAALAGAALEHLASTEARFASLLEHSR